MEAIRGLSIISIILVVALILVYYYIQLMDIVADIRGSHRFTSSGKLQDKHLKFLRNKLESGHIVIIHKYSSSRYRPHGKITYGQAIDMINNNYLEITKEMKDENGLDTLTLFTLLAEKDTNVFVINENIGDIQDMKEIVGRECGLLVNDTALYSDDTLNYIIDYNDIPQDRIYRLGIKDRKCSKLKEGYVITVDTGGRVRDFT